MPVLYKPIRTNKIPLRIFMGCGFMLCENFKVVAMVKSKSADIEFNTEIIIKIVE